MITTRNLIEIYCFVDEFCKEFDKTMEAYQINEDSTKNRRKRLSTYNDTEVIINYKIVKNDIKTYPSKD